MNKDFENFIYEEITLPDFTMSSAVASRRTEMEKEIGQAKTDSMFQVLAVLREQGDVPDVTREIFHTVYLKTKKHANRLKKSLSERGYKVFSIFAVFESCIWVKFSHVGPATLEAIFTHAKVILGLVKGCDGDYDGWETSIENDQPDQEEMERKFHEHFAIEISHLSRNFQNPDEFIRDALRTIDSNS